MADPRIWPLAFSRIDSVAVGVASILVVPANPHRADCDLTNDGAATIYLARGEAAVIGSGLPLRARGGTYHFGQAGLWLGEIYAIATAPECNLAISEGTNAP